MYERNQIVQASSSIERAAAFSGIEWIQFQNMFLVYRNRLLSNGILIYELGRWLQYVIGLQNWDHYLDGALFQDTRSCINGLKPNQGAYQVIEVINDVVLVVKNVSISLHA